MRNSKGWIGLEFGHRGITIAQVQRSAQGVRIAASAELPRTVVPRDANESVGTYQNVSRQEIQAAKMLVPGLSGRAAACVLPMSVTELTHATLPPAEPAEQLAMIANELGDSFPDGHSQREFDFWYSDLPRGDKSSAMTDVNVISLSAQRTTPVAESFAGTGLDCRVLDGIPHAVARAVTMASMSGSDRPLAAVHLAPDSGVFVLARDGVPVFTRHLRNGGTHRIATNLSQALGLLEEEATQVLREFGLPNPDLADAEGGANPGSYRRGRLGARRRNRRRTATHT
jgi:Tfp pilus assembly PilM family ATPase